MKKYRMKPYKNSKGITRYVVERRYWLFFWTHVIDFMKKEDAEIDCKKRNDFIEFE